MKQIRLWHIKSNTYNLYADFFIKKKKTSFTASVKSFSSKLLFCILATTTAKYFDSMQLGGLN